MLNPYAISHILLIKIILLFITWSARRENGDWHWSKEKYKLSAYKQALWYFPNVLYNSCHPHSSVHSDFDSAWTCSNPHSPCGRGRAAANWGIQILLIHTWQEELHWIKPKARNYSFTRPKVVVTRAGPQGASFVLGDFKLQCSALQLPGPMGWWHSPSSSLWYFKSLKLSTYTFIEFLDVLQVTPPSRKFSKLYPPLYYMLCSVL